MACAKASVWLRSLVPPFNVEALDAVADCCFRGTIRGKQWRTDESGDASHHGTAEGLFLLHPGEIEVQDFHHRDAVHLEVVLYLLFQNLIERRDSSKSCGDDKRVDALEILQEGEICGQEVDLLEMDVFQLTELVIL